MNQTMNKQKIKNGVLLNSQQDVQQLTTMRLPPITTLKIVKNIKAVSAALEPVLEVRKQLIEKYGKESKEGAKDWSITPQDVESMNAFNNDFKEVLDQESEVKIEKIVLTENSSNCSVPISPVKEPFFVGYAFCAPIIKFSTVEKVSNAVAVGKT